MKRRDAMKFHPARQWIKLTPGDCVRILRKLQHMTQKKLAEATGIDEPTIAAIEAGRASVTVARRERLARALRVHPAVVLFPRWNAEDPPPDEARHRCRKASARVEP